MTAAPFKPEVIIFDVDGVLTDGAFYYSAEGKLLKAFGPDDNDALSLLASFVSIRFVTGDRKGFEISRRRVVEDMGFELDLVSTIKRIDWIRERFDSSKTVYMGDGIFDHYVMREVGYSLAPSNASEEALKAADFVTRRSGGDRAVAEACLHLMAKFFEPFDFGQLPRSKGKLSGEWSA